MPRNVFKVLLAADGGAVINADEAGAAFDMSANEKATFGAAGTFGGGTMTLQIDVAGTGTFVTTGLTLTAAGKVDLTIPCKFARWNMTGSTTPSVTMSVAARTLDQ